jgi:hypothetical protein
MMHEIHVHCAAHNILNTKNRQIAKTITFINNMHNNFPK